MESNEDQIKEKNRLYGTAYQLTIITIVYTILEGIVSTYFGYDNRSLALFGFGVNSFIKVLSSIGIASMLTRRIGRPKSRPDNFEKTLLKISGFLFYLLALGLVAVSIYTVLTHKAPNATTWGVVISIFSLIVMGFLIMEKTKIGLKLNSEAILADAACSRVSIYIPIVLLISSGIFELFDFFIGINSIGALGIAYFAFKEGKECFDKIKSNLYSCTMED